MDVIIHLFDGEPGGLLLPAAGENRLPVFEIKVCLFGCGRYCLPGATPAALGEELPFLNTSL